MKRFTDTQKWEDPWFRTLPVAHKLVFLYVVDRCNNAGFMELDTKAITFHTLLEINEVREALKGLSKGVKWAGGWLWICRFLRHQKNEPINPNNPAHKQIIGQISQQVDRFSKCPEFNEFIGPLMGLLRPIGIGIGIGIGKGNSLGEVQENPFLKPTLDEAILHGTEIAMYPDTVGDWHDYYEARGWVLSGAAPMKDWKASMRSWNKRSFNKPNGSTEATKQPKKPFYFGPPGDHREED